MSFAVSHWHLTTGAHFQSEASPGGMYGGESGSRTCFTLVPLV
jgi:hypothetical protein